MKGSSLELREVFEENSHKGRNILGSFLCGALITQLCEDRSVQNLLYEKTYHIFPELRIREPNAYWLVNKKDVCMIIPPVWVEFGLVCSRHSAWT